MRETLEVISAMEAGGVFDKFVIGGAVAASIYVEAVSTIDLDIFIPIKPVPGSLLVSDAPIADYLSQRGFKRDQEGRFVIHGWPVQFLPVANTPLQIDAFDNSVVQEIEGIKAHVLTPEHCMALSLELGGHKYWARLRSFIDQEVYDEQLFHRIMARFGLLNKWGKFQSEERQQLE